jgi:hypothetical protein
MKQCWPVFAAFGLSGLGVLLLGASLVLIKVMPVMMEAWEQSGAELSILVILLVKLSEILRMSGVIIIPGLLPWIIRTAIWGFVLFTRQKR